MVRDSSDLITELVKALADADGLDPTDVDYSLHDYVETDVLRGLDEMDNGPWEFTFHVTDHQVTITHDGEMWIDGVDYSTKS